MSLREFFDSMPNVSKVTPFNNEDRFGLVISFAEKGRGFGEIAFAVDKITGLAEFDNEEMSMETCARILMRLAEPDEEKKERVCECGCPANKHMLGGGYCGTGECYTSEDQKEYAMRVHNLPDKPVCNHLRLV